MNIIIEQGTKSDIEELSQLYDNLNDYLEKGINYPGWIKGIYPIRQNALDGVANGTLHVAKQSDKIVGSIILSHDPEPAYHKVKWNIDVDYSEIFVIHTFVVHPAYLKTGIGKSLLNFAIQHSKNEHMKSIRLDVYKNNIPAIRLYEKYDFIYVETVDLGLVNYGLDYFKLYEKLL